MRAWCSFVERGLAFDAADGAPAGCDEGANVMRTGVDEDNKGIDGVYVCQALAWQKKSQCFEGNEQK